MDKQDCPMNNGNIQVLTLILSENQCHKCVRLAKELGIKGMMVMIGKGTVNSTVLNLLGIRSQRKEIVKLLLKKENTQEVLDYFSEGLQLSKPGHGIAFVTPIIGAAGLVEQEADHKQITADAVKHMEGKRMFKKITVIVDRGMSGDVMDIARKVGVRGGTILHGRGAGAEIATGLFGMEIEPEKELVIILAPNDLVDKVACALSEELNLEEPGKGILFVEPVVDTRGLIEMNDKESD